MSPEKASPAKEAAGNESPAEKENDVASLFEQRGIRWTPQRQLVLDTFQRRSGHISAEEVHSEISKTFPRVNLSTVYRTLELLCELGVAVEVVPNKGDDRRRYELVEGAEHYHLICEICGAEMELAPEVIKQLQAQIQERYNFQLKLPHFVGLGRCANCRENEAEQTRTSDHEHTQSHSHGPGHDHTHTHADGTTHTH
ncbi:MAG: transcriptional repressor [Chloroflexi bacterium]|nr:transcriptional repressor [Chloroflexota bacterium]OJW02821.1 MAG: hypothetical protein BGO39_06245 [Chloroflexi bacterium 54-19]